MKAKKNYLSEGIKITDALMSDIIFMCETRVKKTYFTRVGNNKMTFKSILTFMLNFVKKSLQLELDDFFNGMNGTSLNVTKQAFSSSNY